MKKITTKQAEKARALLGEFDELRDYSERDDKLFSVNVKLYHQDYELADVAERFPKKYRARIKDEYTDERVGEIIDNQLGYEVDYWVSDWPDGVAFNPDEPEWEMLQRIDRKSIGLYGRSGGHYCFDIVTSDENALEELLNNEGYEDRTNYGTADEILVEAEKTLEAVRWFKSEIEKAHGYLDSKEWVEGEIGGDIEVNLEDWEYDDKKEREIKRAKKIAKEYGYVLAKEV